MMRVAIVSDIHGNCTAFEAVLADLRQTSPDLIFHGGDLADAGSSPVEIVDRIRDLGWQGVIGNGEEALSTPETLEDFASQSKAPPSLWVAVRDMMAWTRCVLGEERIAWLGGLPRIQMHGLMALVHASPESPWRAPMPEAGDAELESVYSPLGQPVAVYGHIHRPFVRSVSGMTVANTGSVSLSYEGDRRAAYLLLDDSTPIVRRVEYDVDQEIKALSGCSLPHSEWIAKTLQTGRPQMP
jgi:predicted phosphodiesterase